MRREAILSIRKCYTLWSLSRSGYRLRFEVGRDRIRVSFRVRDRVRVRGVF